MKTIFLLKTRKISAFFLITIFVANLVFGYILIPAKETQAAWPVDVITDIIFTAWAKADLAWKKLDVLLQTSTKVSSGLSAGVDIWDKALTIATQLLQSALLLALHTILQMITNEVIKWINGQGEPLFISDWGAFLRKAADQAGGVFLDTLSGGLLCQPFAFHIRMALMPTSYYKQARCTLKQIGRNLQNFFKSFTKGGGWETWIHLSQPQNNLYGGILMALDENEARKIAAAEKAKNEAMASGGFMGDKKCDRCHTTDTDGKIIWQGKSVSECEVSFGDFTCDHYSIVTPGALVKAQAQEAINTMRETIYSTISGAASQTGPLAPYVMSILSALINRVIREGLQAVSSAVAGGNSSYGPTINNPDIPMPGEDPRITGLDPTGIAKAQEILSASPALIDPLKLLKENIESELLAKQQQNLNILTSAKNTQTETLNKFKDILENNCVLPSWASSQILSSSTTNGVTTEFIKITAVGTGDITIKTASSSLGISYEITETNAEAASQVNAKQAEVNNTQQWIKDVETAINANRDAITAAEKYEELYEKLKGGTPTAAQKAELDEARKKMFDAYDLALSSTKKAGKSEEGNLTLLLADI